MPANIVLRNLTNPPVKGNSSPIIATRADLRGGARGGAQEPSAPGEAPVISAFTGSFAQGNTVTLSGSFSVKRNGQMLYLSGSDVSEGELPPGFSSIGQIIPESPHGQTVLTSTAENSFSRGGRSFGATFGPSIANPAFYFDEPVREVFFSAELWASVDQATNAPSANEQYKWTRIVSSPGLHNSLPQLWIQRDLAAEGRLGYELAMGVVDYRYQAYPQDLQTGRKWADPADPDLSNRSWHRQILHIANQSAESASDARVFARIIDHGTNRQIPFTKSSDQSDRSWIDGETETNPLFSWLAPAVHKITDAAGNPLWNEPDFNQTFSHVILPFYSFNGGVRLLADCIYINDSAERVELGNAPIMDDCTKLVVQRQLSRSTSGIQFQVEEGNLDSSDDVYAFVVNSDTSYSQGTLIRGAV